MAGAAAHRDAAWDFSHAHGGALPSWPSRVIRFRVAARLRPPGVGPVSTTLRAAARFCANHFAVRARNAREAFRHSEPGERWHSSRGPPRAGAAVCQPLSRGFARRRVASGKTPGTIIVGLSIPGTGSAGPSSPPIALHVRSDQAMSEQQGLAMIEAEWAYEVLWQFCRLRM